MKIYRHISGAIAATLFVCACGSDEIIAPIPNENKALSGGQATVFDASSQAFEMPIPTLSADELDKFFAGDASLEQVFVDAAG